MGVQCLFFSVHDPSCGITSEDPSSWCPNRGISVLCCRETQLQHCPNSNTRCWEVVLWSHLVGANRGLFNSKNPPSFTELYTEWNSPERHLSKLHEFILWSSAMMICLNPAIHLWEVRNPVGSCYHWPSWRHCDVQIRRTGNFSKLKI